MKYKLVALILALTIASWAQSTNSRQAPATDKTAAKTKCACCEKMSSTAKPESSEHKQACMHASAKDGTETASCCAGEDKASCCKGKDGKACTKASAGCCGENCADMKDCCSAKEAKKTAHNCCGAGQCRHEHHQQPTAGN
jgi:hypothetical protein